MLSTHNRKNVAIFTNFKECNAGHVMFRDGVGGMILNKVSINQFGLPCLQDVRLVKGLSTKLIIISQLCDQGFFSKIQQRQM